MLVTLLKYKTIYLLQKRTSKREKTQSERKMKPLLAVLFLSILLFNCKENSNSSTREKQKEAPRPSTVSQDTLEQATITKGDVFMPEEFVLVLGEELLIADAHGQLSFGNLSKKIEFEKNFYTRKINFYNQEDEIILFFELSDHDGSYNDVYCLDKEKLEIKWKTQLRSFNLTVGEAENNILYLSAGENAYALDMNTGDLFWQTPGFYHTLGFPYFHKMTLINDEIHLKGNAYVKGFGEVNKTVILNKIDGKVLTVR